MLVRALYLSTHPESWGDGHMNARLLRGFVHRFPMSRVYYIGHEQTTSTIAPTLMMEGLVDWFISTQSELPLKSWAPKRFNGIHLDWIVGGWVYQDIRQIPKMFPGAQITAIPSAAHLYQNLKRYVPYTDVIGTRIDDEYLYTATSIREQLVPLIKQINPQKKTVAFFPMATRTHATLYPNAIHLILDRLAEWNVILMGAEAPIAYASYEGEWISIINQVRNRGIDALGFSPLKQIELIKYCQLAIIPPGGALIIPMLYQIPMIVLEMGISSCIPDILNNINRDFGSVKTACPLYPCEGRMRSDCISIPQCLSSEFPIDIFDKTLSQYE